MKAYEIIPNSFCYGVKRAIDIALKFVNNPNTKKPIYMLGNLVHNDFVVSYFLDKVTIIKLCDLENITDGSLIITAHGVSPDIIRNLEEKGIMICDATCPNVSHVQKQIHFYLDKGYNIRVIGNQNHPEVLSYLGISKNVKIYDKNEILPSKTFITTQTTLIYEEVTKDLKECINNNVDIIIDQEICNATSMRQKALLYSLDLYDLFLIIGDRQSNNCNSLLEIVLNHHKKGFLINNVEDLKLINLQGVNRIGVTAGASTPHIIVLEVIDCINNNKDFVSNISLEEYVKC